jgi:hypothetical protein
MPLADARERITPHTELGPPESALPNVEEAAGPSTTVDEKDASLELS